MIIMASCFKRSIGENVLIGSDKNGNRLAISQPGIIVAEVSKEEYLMQPEIPEHMGDGRLERAGKIFFYKVSTD